jgi:hypothetical protein
MQGNLLAIITALLVYQGVYYLYLLYIGSGWVCPYFPYAIFQWRFVIGYALESRMLLLLVLSSINYPKIRHVIQGFYLKDWKTFGKSCVEILLALGFIFVEQLGSLELILWTYPALLVLILLSLPLPSNLLNNKHSSLQVTNPHYHAATPLSISLPTQQGSLPINNPQRGIYILGNQGSGKTRFVLEPMLYALIQKGYAGLIYDYDFEAVPANPDRSYCLTKFAYNCFVRFKPAGMQFRSINFTDPSSSARINPFAPRYIQNRAYLEEYVQVLLHNLNPATNKAPDFWIRSTQALLKSIIVFLHNNFPHYCTLPHAISFALLPLEQVLACIRFDLEAYAYASSIFDAFDGKQDAAGQLAGITATFKVSLQLLLDKQVFWVLSGEDMSLAMNDQNHPTILCIGNVPPAKAAYSPIIALIITVCFKAMYGHNRVKSFVAIDELPTLYIPDLSELPATARKYGIATIACVQSNAQLEHTYGAIGAKKIQQTLVNKISGSAEDESAIYISKLLGKQEQLIGMASENYSMQEGKVSESHGTSQQRQLKDVLTPQQIMGFRVGEFAGKVAESDTAFFHLQMKPVSSYDRKFTNEQLKELPVGQKQIDLEANYLKIQRQAAGIPQAMKRLQQEKENAELF